MDVIHDKLTHEHSICSWIIWVEMSPDVSNQCNNYDRVNSQDVANPTIQHPVLKDEPGDESKTIIALLKNYTGGGNGLTVCHFNSKNNAEVMRR